jgi:hypothetical protein
MSHLTQYLSVVEAAAALHRSPGTSRRRCIEVGFGIRPTPTGDVRRVSRTGWRDRRPRIQRPAQLRTKAGPATTGNKRSRANRRQFRDETGDRALCGAVCLACSPGQFATRVPVKAFGRFSRTIVIRWVPGTADISRRPESARGVNAPCSEHESRMDEPRTPLNPRYPQDCGGSVERLSTPTKRRPC